MFNYFRKELIWGNRQLILETGKIARQADGAVLATYGETKVLCTVVGAKLSNPNNDFFPLTVNYQEKTFATGKIPGGFFKREGRPSEKEILVSRMIDRPIRPLFADGFYNETQVICTVLSNDLENDPSIVAIIGASAALTISGIPFIGPIGAACIGYIDGQYLLNPTYEQLTQSSLEMIVAGTTKGVLMVESEAKELSEEVMLGAVTFGHNSFQQIIKTIIELAELCAKDPWTLNSLISERALVNEKLIAGGISTIIEDAYNISNKQDRHTKIDNAKAMAIEILSDNTDELAILSRVFSDLEFNIMRNKIFNTGIRIDGRDTKTVRPISIDVGILPRTHGSALFTRGETQALVVTTLGTGQDEQIIDALEGEYRECFMLHYNFPPYSVGEIKYIGSPNRREIGHGKLAWRAIHPILPTKEVFPYTVRVVSEITESNGSSSMATVCGSSLSLMDAGVPLSRPVAGIAMGLIKKNDNFIVLTDIIGDEDHLGDMDFKVAGTEVGITALQMDIKITSITEEIMKTSLNQAKIGRLHILKEMTKVLKHSRETISKNAPSIVTFSIPKEKIREIIGTGGKVIREICEQTGAKIDIEDDGTIKVASINSNAGQRAMDWIKNIVAEPKIGCIYNGKVVKVADFGAFVNFLGSTDGLIHISELASKRIGKVTDIVNVGDSIKVKIIGFDDRGRVKLSLKQVNQDTGEDLIN
jgi:polyribonucleotide nucleotidyltransferase